MLLNPQIIFEDDFLIAVEKPTGTVVNNADSVGEAETIEDFATEYIFNKKITSKESIFFQRKGIIHRLDKDTSGILLIAKNEAMFDEMQKKFKNREVKKKYFVLVHGILKNEGDISGNIKRNKSKGKFMVGENGKASLTEYVRQNVYKFNKEALNDFEIINYQRLQKRYDMENFSSALVQIHTGRTHQIRVHFSFIKHPVAGDALYGFRKIVKFEKMWCPRQFLHAEELVFEHPVTKNMIVLKSQLPGDLVDVLKKYMKKA